MVFQRISPKLDLEEVGKNSDANIITQSTEMETVVGPSVQVEGDFSSEGNIIVRGMVTGSIHTTNHLLVESGAKVVAHIQVGSACISGDVKGNIKAREKIELTSSARVIGDIETKILSIQAGALLLGKVTMLEVESDLQEEKNKYSASSKNNLGRSKKN